MKTIDVYYRHKAEENEIGDLHLSEKAYARCVQRENNNPNKSTTIKRIVYATISKHNVMRLHFTSMPL